MVNYDKIANSLQKVFAASVTAEKLANFQSKKAVSRNISPLCDMCAQRREIAQSGLKNPAQFPSARRKILGA